VTTLLVVIITPAATEMPTIHENGIMKYVIHLPSIFSKMRLRAYNEMLRQVSVGSEMEQFNNVFIGAFRADLRARGFGSLAVQIVCGCDAATCQFTLTICRVRHPLAAFVLRPDGMNDLQIALDGNSGEVD